MPVAGPLPQTGDQHDINADADRCFRARCPRDWRVHSLEGTDDYGLDFNIQTTPGQQATDIFRVQLKGTRSPDFSADEEFVSIQLKASTVRYYDRLVEPVLLVVCDLSVDPEPVDCQLYYAWLRDELRRIDVSRLPEDQKYVTLRVPTANKLRGADLSAEIQRQNELSRAGHAIDVRVEQTHPGLEVEERVSIVQGVTKGIAARSAAFIDALSAPVEEHWLNPPPHSLPWHLNRAKEFMRTTLLASTARELQSAEGMLDGATSLEESEYWFLRGKFLTAAGSDVEASAAFKQAHAKNALSKYLAAWAEAEIRVRYDGVGPAPYPDLLAALVGEDPFILSAKSRVLAAEGRFDDSISTADRISGPERHAARALAHTMYSKPAEALADCDRGLAESNLPENARQMLLVLRARAMFSLAQPAMSGDEDITLPPRGTAGTDAIKVKAAWYAIEAAVDVLREVGWSSNIEHVADIWGVTASILGKQKETLLAFSEAARVRPHLENVQASLESLAAQCGEFSVALEANDRLPESHTRNLRRTLLLHEAQQHGACLRWFDHKFESFDRRHELFGPAATVAALSAHRLARPDLVGAWAAALESTSELREHAALLHYYLALELNKLGNDEALRSLLVRYDELGRPFDMAVALLQELNPTDQTQAEELIEVAAKVREKVEPSPAMAVHVGLALVTTERWHDLLALCEDLKARIPAGPRMLAFEALALDRLGSTDKARQLLEQMLAGGLIDRLALNTYVTIMVRCGYVEEALKAAERIMEAATSKKQRMDCIRLLFNLIQNSDPSSNRLFALATQMGALADRDSEVEEGIYLVMSLTATLAESNKPSDVDRSEFQERAIAFFAKFPNSKIIRKGEFREDATAEDLLAQLKQLAGITEDREAFRTRIENQLQQGLTIVPFSWRPQLILSAAHDAVHLWEIAKTSGVDDRKFHLSMISDVNWTPPAAASLRDRTPLMDLTALMVLFDLGLIDKAVEFFGRVAIAKSTLETLATLVNPFSGSPLRSKCLSLQNALKPHYANVMQPSAADLPDEGEDGESEAVGREHKEIIRLCTEPRGHYRLYSDDLAFRVLCSGGHPSDGICTLDVLAGLAQVGSLSRREVAAKIATLCAWRVGLVVRYEDLVSLIPEKIREARSVGEGIAILDADRDFTVTVSAIWDFRARFEGTLAHAAAVLRRLADESDLNDVAAAAVLGQWYVRAGLKNDAPPSALQVLTRLVLRAAQPGHLSKPASYLLWSVYKRLVEHQHGSYMDEAKEREGIQLLGVECAKLQATNRQVGEVVFNGLREGLTDGTSDYANFSSAYSTTLVRIAATRR